MSEKLDELNIETQSAFDETHCLKFIEGFHKPLVKLLGKMDDKIEGYDCFVENLFKLMADPQSTIHHAATGLSGESGEALDLSKKYWANNKPLNLWKMVEELGDVRFYYQAMLNKLGITDDEVIAFNIAKLEERYPGGVYSDKMAQARLDKK